MALRAGYYGIKRGLKAKLVEIVGIWDQVKNEVDEVLPDGIIANTRLIKDTVGWSGKNKLRNDIVSQTLHTTVISVNADKSVSFTNAPNNELWLTVNSDIRLSAGRYKLSGCPNGGGNTKYFLRFVVRDAGDTANEETYFDYGTGTEFEITSITAGRKCTCSIYIKSGQATGFTYYPMICDADILDDSYEPYFGSTVETILSDQKTAINAIITAATGAADFAAFKTAMGAITPVTRSLSLTKEDITEEVKEDVEPEKTVTKKRTTKKTEEV